MPLLEAQNTVARDASQLPLMLQEPMAALAAVTEEDHKFQTTHCTQACTNANAYYIYDYEIIYIYIRIMHIQRYFLCMCTHKHTHTDKSRGRP